MKTSLTLLLQIILLSSICSQSFTNKNGDKHLWGTVTVDQLMQEPYADWFEKYQQDYTSTLTKKDGKKLKDVKVKAFLGTWCGDTKFLLPKFVEAWKTMGLKEDQIEFVALHVEDEKYKQGPNKETDDYNIHKVPTFVFEKDGKEIGRIVERAVFDLDTDIQLIAEGRPYKNRYKGVCLLDEYLKTVNPDSLMTKTAINNAYRKISREAPKASVMNTYGYMLKYQGKTDKARMVFKLNKLMFPYEPNAHDSYGEILLENNELKEAQEEYYEALRLIKEDEHIVKKLAEIAEKLSEQDS